MANEINPKKQVNASDYIIALIFCIIFVMICALFSTKVIHWFIFPLIPCGILIGADAAGWLRGKYDLFDPKGLLGVLGLHFFFTSQLLAIVWEAEAPVTAISLDDYRPWIGLLAVLNLFGLAIYRGVEHYVSNKRYKRETAKVWLCKESSWGWILLVFFAIAFIAQAYLIGQGYIGRLSYDPTARAEVKGGTGILRLLSGAGPIFLIILLTLIRSKTASKPSNLIVVYIIMGIMGVFALFFGGLVGSRGATIWSVFWIGGIIHFFWRRIPVKHALVGLLALLVFMNIYGFFKKLGTSGLQMFAEEGFATAAAESGINIKAILIGDLSRTTVNTYMAYVLVEKPYSYDYRWGKTIIGDVLVQFPMWLYSNSYNQTGTSGKMKAGTDLMMGSGVYNAYDPFSKSRYAYGLTGQVMLNFGVLPIPLIFAVLGYFVGRLRRSISNWEPYDMRFFMIPIYIHLLISFLTHDMENQLNAIIFKVALPFLIIWFISNKIPRYLVDEAAEEELTMLDNELQY